ncbi:hypothetical protein CCP2SC5_220026 [Azospirillaceae bacterium]
MKAYNLITIFIFVIMIMSCRNSPVEATVITGENVFIEEGEQKRQENILSDYSYLMDEIFSGWLIDESTQVGFFEQALCGASFDADDERVAENCRRLDKLSNDARKKKRKIINKMLFHIVMNSDDVEKIDDKFDRDLKKVQVQGLQQNEIKILEDKDRERQRRWSERSNQEYRVNNGYNDQEASSNGKIKIKYDSGNMCDKEIYYNNIICSFSRKMKDMQELIAQDALNFIVLILLIFVIFIVFRKILRMLGRNT